MSSTLTQLMLHSSLVEVCHLYTMFRLAIFGTFPMVRYVFNKICSSLSTIVVTMADYSSNGPSLQTKEFFAGVWGRYFVYEVGLFPFHPHPPPPPPKTTTTTTYYPHLLLNIHHYIIFVSNSHHGECPLMQKVIHSHYPSPH